MNHHAIYGVNNQLTEKPGISNEMFGDTLRPGGLELTTHIATLADIKENQTVLEIGCGKGTTTAFLAQQYSCRVTGIDLSEEMVATAQARIAEENLSNRVSILKADGECLPFADSIFDIVISECTFCLMSNREKAAMEIHRVLKPGGRFILTNIILRGKVDQKLLTQAPFPSCITGAHSLEDNLQFFRKLEFDPFYIEDQSEKLMDIGFQLITMLGNPCQFSELILGTPNHKKEQNSSSTSTESIWSLLKQSRPGYAVIIMKKLVKSHIKEFSHD